VLAWNTVFPRWNPFERFYDRAVGRRRGLPRLQPAPGPRRSMQGMATGFMLVVGLALSLGWRTTAYVFEGFLIAAFAALLGGKFCAGAYIYHVLRGRVDFAGATCPWSRS
jgi:predicted CDP-diglyceride synthetase/phosphatidate cytidylyltransferase